MPRYHSDGLSPVHVCFEIFSKQICNVEALICHFYNKPVLEPQVSPAFAITYFCNHCNIRFENTSKYVDTLTFFPKTWTKGHWPLDDLWPHVCWGHKCDSIQGSLCPSPMTIHQCMWIQWSILQNTTYILHTTYYVHTTYILWTYYVQNEWSHSLLLNSVQARQKHQNSHTTSFPSGRRYISYRHYFLLALKGCTKCGRI